jgi:hypothetical protein
LLVLDGINHGAPICEFFGYEDVPVTDLEFLLEVRELLWLPRERAKPYSLTR